MSESPNPPQCQRHPTHPRTVSSDHRAHEAAPSAKKWPTRAMEWFGRLLLRNRVTLALLSLAWLLWRSGSQPRRLAYPCQQAALGNLGIFGVLLLPGGVLHDHGRRHGKHRRRGVVPLAVVMCLAAGGITLYLNKPAGPGEPPGLQRATSGTGVPAVVAIARDEDGAYTDLELERLVRRAVAMAGGLEPIMIDRRGGGPAPFDAPDGQLRVIILPNMSGLSPGLNTDPRVTRTVVKLAWEAGADVVNLGGAATGDNATVFFEQGYDTNRDGKLDRDPRVSLIDLNETGTEWACPTAMRYENVTRITLPETGPGAAVARSSYYVHNELLKADVMIVVPTLKNHDLGTITLGLKMRIGTAPQDLYFAPWLGCDQVPYLRWEMHNHIYSGYATKYPWDRGTPPTSEPEAVQRSLVDLNLVRPHDFVVVDGLVGCESGPLNYDEPPSRVQAILASRDTLALDTIGALVMGYDPDRIPCLTLANDTQVLGVMDRRLITVVGERVMPTRVDFRLDHSTGYAKPYRAESIPPDPPVISLFEGQPVPATSTAVIACSNVKDNVGVIKAELALRPIPPNLLVNGGFEEGSAGWSTYHATWGGHDGQINFNSTEPGRVGNSALHLSLPPGKDDSFAVYQEVPVTPGTAYRLNARWKANRYGQDSWYEIMLIDGPWDPVQADTGGAIVLSNHMFAYDTNPSANCPAGNPIPASFDWVATQTQYGQNVDNCWNDRDGVRIASGNVMTVVLKAGSCCGTNRADVWFDEVSLTEVMDDEIVVARAIDPPEAFELPWDATSVPVGAYQARFTVYDAMMNEVTVIRNIEIVGCQAPSIELQPKLVEKTIWAGQSCPDETFTVANACSGTLDYTITPSHDWLAADPASGQSDGYPPNTHTLKLACETLPVGDHTATLTVSAPNAENDPQVLTVKLHVKSVRADLDGDGDVDQSDFAIMQRCFCMPGTFPEPGCEIARLDADFDVDGNDFAILHGCHYGPGVYPPPDCMP